MKNKTMTNSQYKQIMKTTPLQKKIAALKVEKNNYKKQRAEFVKNLDANEIKTILICKDVGIPYCPELKINLDHAWAFYAPGIAERAILNCNSDLEKTDEDHSDEICKVTGIKSDTKTSSFSNNHMKGYPNSHQGHITGVRSQHGELKDGALRVMVTDQFLMKCHYFYLPKNVWQNWKIQGSGKNSSGAQPAGSISYTYNRKTGTIAKLEPYRVNSFIELANKTD